MTRPVLGILSILVVLGAGVVLADGTTGWSSPPPDGPLLLELPSGEELLPVERAEALGPADVEREDGTSPPLAVGGWHLHLEDGREVAIAGARCPSQAAAATLSLGVLADPPLRVLVRRGGMVVSLEGSPEVGEVARLHRFLWGELRGPPDLTGVALPAGTAFRLTPDEISPMAEEWEELWRFTGRVVREGRARSLRRSPTCRASLREGVLLVLAVAPDGGRWALTGEVSDAVASLGFVLATGAPRPGPELLEVVRDLRDLGDLRDGGHGG